MKRIPTTIKVKNVATTSILGPASFGNFEAHWVPFDVTVTSFGTSPVDPTFATPPVGSYIQLGELMIVKYIIIHMATDSVGNGTTYLLNTPVPSQVNGSITTLPGTWISLPMSYGRFEANIGSVDYALWTKVIEANQSNLIVAILSGVSGTVWGPTISTGADTRLEQTVFLVPAGPGSGA